MSLRVIGYVPAWVLSFLPTTDLNRRISLLLMFVARSIRRTKSSTHERGSVAAVDTWPLGALTHTSMTCDIVEGNVCGCKTAAGSGGGVTAFGGIPAEGCVMSTSSGTLVVGITTLTPSRAINHKPRMASLNIQGLQEEKVLVKGR